MNQLITGIEQQLGQGLDGWMDVLGPWRQSAEGHSTLAKVDQRLVAGATVFPDRVFRALQETSLDDVAVVILGQDPYHGEGQANGLAFSVSEGVPIPRSLRNVYKELVRSFPGAQAPSSGDLSGWARQGVLLLNTTLTVEEGAAHSHAGYGWTVLTDRLIAAVAARARETVFMLWGAHAQRSEAIILASGQSHLILKSNHPSPLSALRPPVPFIGNGHFRLANEFLRRHNRPEIAWL